MTKSKFIIALIGIVAVVIAVTQLGSQPNTVEGWWNQQGRRWKTFPVTKQRYGATAAVGGNFLGPLNDDNFIKTPQFQGLLAPRFNNFDVGANIRYDPPDHRNMATPCNPLTFGDMARENYNGCNKGYLNGCVGCAGSNNLPNTPPPGSLLPPPNYSSGNYQQSIESIGGGGTLQEGYDDYTYNQNYPTSCGAGGCSGGCAPSCGKGGMPVPRKSYLMSSKPGYAAGDYNKVMDQSYDSSSYPDAQDMLPVGTMTGITADGSVVQPVVYTQFVFANQKSRLRGLGDPIRGDLPIVPCEGNWFSVHPNVNLDLHEGAMNVMGGVGNQTNQALSKLIWNASGNADTTIGGVNIQNDLNMIPEYNGSYSAALGDVTISGMP